VKAFRASWEWVFSPGDARRLAALRIGLCAALAARLSRGLYLEMASQPSALFRPRSFMNLFAHMPPRGAVLALQIAGVAAAVLAAAGIRARVALPVAFACALVLDGMHTSLGKVMHNDVLLLVALVPLLAAPVSDAWSFHARGRPTPPISGRFGWPVRVAMLVVAGGYFFTGLAKLRFSGLEWFTGSNLRWVLYASSDAQPTPNWFAIFVADRAWLAHLFTAGALALECTFPLAVVRPRLAPFSVAGAAIMHGSIWLAMSLDYTAWVATVMVVFVDWPGVVERVRAAVARRRLAHAVG
jgi:hypothetical protein